MTPLLLDQKSIYKAGFSIAIVMVMIFTSGYFVGYQKAESGKGVNLNKTMVLALPKPAHADISAYQPFFPQVPGAEIDVDSPQVSADVIDDDAHEATPVSHAEKEVAAAIKLTTNAIDAPAKLGSQHDEQMIAEVASESERAGNHQQTLAKIQTSTSSADSSSQAFILDSASADDARYTVQVGAFADAENAIRRKTELELKQLTAYISEYRNKRDELRFNVRFGYFKDKSSAVAALASFQHNMSGSGYVTRIRQN